MPSPWPNTASTSTCVAAAGDRVERERDARAARRRPRAGSPPPWAPSRRGRPRRARGPGRRQAAGDRRPQVGRRPHAGDGLVLAGGRVLGRVLADRRAPTANGGRRPVDRGGEVVVAAPATRPGAPRRRAPAARAPRAGRAPSPFRRPPHRRRAAAAASSKAVMPAAASTRSGAGSPARQGAKTSRFLTGVVAGRLDVVLDAGRDQEHRPGADLVVGGRRRGRSPRPRRSSRSGRTRGCAARASMPGVAGRA